MESSQFRAIDKGQPLRPRLKKTSSTLTGLQPHCSLPKLITPRAQLTLSNSRKFSLGGYTSRFPHLEPLPPITIKNKNTDRFGQSPILAVESDDDHHDKEIQAFIKQIERKRFFKQN